MPQNVDLNCRQGEIFHFLDRLPEEIQDRIYSFLPPNDFIRCRATSKTMQRRLEQGQCWKIHLSKLLPGLQTPQTLEKCSKAIQQQYDIRGNMSQGKCRPICAIPAIQSDIPGGKINNLIFVPKPTEDGVYTLIVESDYRLMVMHVRPNTLPEFGDSRSIREPRNGALAASADGKYVAVATGVTGVMLLPTDNLQAAPQYFAPYRKYGYTSKISFSPAGTHVITSDEATARLFIWDIKNLQNTICELPNHKSMDLFVHADDHHDDDAFYSGHLFSPHGQSIVAWTNPYFAFSMVFLWPNWRDKPTESIIVQDPHDVKIGRPPHHGIVTDVNYSPDGELLLTVSESHVNIYSLGGPHGCALVKQINTLESCLRNDLDFDCGLRSAQFSADNHFLLTMSGVNGQRSGRVQFWKWREAKPIPRTQHKSEIQDTEGTEYECIAWTADNRWFAIGDQSATPTIYELL